MSIYITAPERNDFQIFPDRKPIQIRQYLTLIALQKKTFLYILLVYFSKLIPNLKSVFFGRP